MGISIADFILFAKYVTDFLSVLSSGTDFPSITTSNTDYIEGSFLLVPTSEVATYWGHSLQIPLHFLPTSLAYFSCYFHLWFHELFQFQISFCFLFMSYFLFQLLVPLQILPQLLLLAQNFIFHLLHHVTTCIKDCRLHQRFR